MKLVKFKTKNTYQGKDGKDYHYYNYALVLENGKQIVIKCFNRVDYATLDGVAEYVKTSSK